MARRILTDELINKYSAGEIDRQKLSEILGRTETELSGLFAKRGVKIWDPKRKNRQPGRKKKSRYYDWREYKSHIMFTQTYI